MGPQVLEEKAAVAAVQVLPRGCAQAQPTAAGKE